MVIGDRLPPIREEKEVFPGMPRNVGLPFLLHFASRKRSHASDIYLNLKSLLAPEQKLLPFLLRKTQTSVERGPLLFRRHSPDYGLDAPGVLRGLLITALLLTPSGWIAAGRANALHIYWLSGLGTAAFNTGLGCLCGGILMLYSSYFGKFRLRDRILSRLHLRGDEILLDVGCGHGLLLIGAAKALPRGRAVGVDLWSQRDQSNNSREATLRNAELEGVADRIKVRDGDMRKLPFTDGSFDAVIAHFAIHNISGQQGRREAVREIVRTLRPGGQVALSDLKSVGLYSAELRKAGMSDVKISGLSFWTWPPSRTVTAKKPDATESAGEHKP